MRGRRRTAVIAAAVVVPVLVVASLGFYWFVYLGTPLWDEWHCSKGEAPVTSQDGGSMCMPEGSELSGGDAWDPLGNRPYSCDDRRGWTVIYRDGVNDCLRDGLEIPERWSEGPIRR